MPKIYNHLDEKSAEQRREFDTIVSNLMERVLEDDAFMAYINKEACEYAGIETEDSDRVDDQDRSTYWARYNTVMGLVMSRLQWRVISTLHGYLQDTP